ncbi:MAG: ribosomal protein S18-alanine N-acetyltransferase [Gammaproteobacteria bacterium]
MSTVSPLDIPYLRAVSKSDLERLVEIEDRAYRGQGWSRTIFEDCLNVGYTCWGAALDEGLVGYAIVSIGAGESHLLNLAVDPMYQRQGVARMLLDFACDEASRQQAACMFLEVRPSNSTARNLYVLAGFSEFGRRRGYYPNGAGGTREDALVFCRRLHPA